MQEENEPKKISVCPEHQDYQVPMISTMAFPGAELWCPYCGHDTGCPFGDDLELPITPELKKRYMWYKSKSRKYIRAIASRSCSLFKLSKTQTVKPEDIPQEMQAKFQQEIDKYKFEIKMPVHKRNNQ